MRARERSSEGLGRIVGCVVGVVVVLVMALGVVVPVVDVGGTRSRERVCVMEEVRVVVCVAIVVGVEGDLERRARVDARQRLMEAMGTTQRG